MLFSDTGPSFCFPTQIIVPVDTFMKQQQSFKEIHALQEIPTHSMRTFINGRSDLQSAHVINPIGATYRLFRYFCISHIHDYYRCDQ